MADRDIVKEQLGQLTRKKYSVIVCRTDYFQWYRSLSVFGHGYRLPATAEPVQFQRWFSVSYQTPDFFHQQITNCLINQSIFHLPVYNSVSLFFKQQAWWRKSMKWANIFFSHFDVVDCPLTCWFLKLYRFYCASAVDNRTRLDFHGERRIWDGRQIKQKIKGNSALYIYTDEVLQLICRYIVVWGTNGIQCLSVNFLFHDKRLPTTVEPLQNGHFGT